MQTGDWRVSAYSFTQDLKTAARLTQVTQSKVDAQWSSRQSSGLPCWLREQNRDNWYNGNGTALGNDCWKTVIVLKFPASIAIGGPPSCEVSNVFLGRRERGILGSVWADAAILACTTGSPRSVAGSGKHIRSSCIARCPIKAMPPLPERLKHKHDDQCFPNANTQSHPTCFCIGPHTSLRALRSLGAVNSAPGNCERNSLRSESES